MVETAEEYVLQWDAHAKYVTERFSGLFARQALVDVTLICDEQKLRVHKLVLASCSLYFEEMLQQDLGQEPVIFLDLNFEILKAMVEFMYCGETTIAQQSLPSLLEAAENFKVKELACMVEKTIRPQDDTLECRYLSDQDLSDDEVCCMTKILDDDQESVDESGRSNPSSPLGEKDPVDSGSEQDTFVAHNDSDQEDHTLYESTDLDSRDQEEDIRNDQANSNDSDVSNNNNNNNTLIFTSESVKKGNDGPGGATETSDSLEEDPRGRPTDDTLSYEQCCDILTNDFADHRVGQCLRVYTHKRKTVKSANVVSHLQSSVTPECSSPVCIDLLGEEPPAITLPESLDTDCLLHDYVLGDEPIFEDGFVGGCSEDDIGRSRSYSDSSPGSSSKDTFEDDVAFARSSLRRSVRLSRQDGEFKRSGSKRKRSKELEHRVPDMACNGSSSKRNCKRQTKTRRKDEAAKVSNGPDGAANGAVSPVRYNLTSSAIDRALWGDMSDVVEEQERYLEYYEEDAQIPFAVGLLPLRAALERMQAMPEHQPRKTRSSVAPGKQEFACGKWKYGFHRSDLQRRQTEEDTNAVCHIQISTSAQYRHRKGALEGNVGSLEGAGVVEKQ